MVRVQVLDWFVQICLAIKHIHDRKILHRDLKVSPTCSTECLTVLGLTVLAAVQTQNIFLTGNQRCPVRAAA